MTSKRGRFIIFLSILLLLFSLSAMCFGSYNGSLGKIYDVLMFNFFDIPSGDITKMDIIVLYDIRLPRVLMSILVGFSLSAAGAVYQGCFRNPLVEPFILGASSGAAFGAAVGIVAGGLFLSVSTLAFIFSIMAVFLSYFLSRGPDKTPVVGLILAGVIIGSIFSSLVAILKYISNDAALREITFWIMGGMYYANWEDVKSIFPIVMIVFLSIFLLSYRLNLLSLGDNEAQSLGISPEKNKIFFITAATLLTSICVSNVGIIAWIGLMMPHAARLIIGSDNRWVLIASSLMGAIYLIICDTLARNLTQSEIPVGIITSIIGAPFLLWLLRYKRKELYA